MSISETRAAEPGQAHSDRTPLRMSYEEWLAWDHEGGLTEWVDGEVLVMTPPSIAHQRIVAFVSALLYLFAQLGRLGRVISAPVAMRVRAGGSGREPDVLFLSALHLDRLTDQMVNGPADLVVEVISDESVTRDRSDKFYEYQEGGVREYWIIDPRPGKQRVDLYTLDERGRYQPIPPDTGIYRSVVLPGFWLQEDWLWADEPDPLAALTAILGVERMIAAVQRGA